MHKRTCSNCGKSLFYSSKASFEFCKKINSICKKCAHLLKYPDRKKGNADRLNENSLESFYWIGFICADGHISKDYRLTVSLSKKDEKHIEKLSKFLGNVPVKQIKKDKHSQVKISILHKTAIKKLVEKYNILPNKTYNPISISNLKGRNLLAFIIGFIDGDGSIKNLHKRKDFNLTIKCHSSWKNILGLISTFLSGKDRTLLNNKGYAYFTIGDSKILKKLKKIVLQLNLPILERKWDNINLNFISRHEASQKRIKEYPLLKEKGLKDKEIAQILGVKSACISIMKKRNNL